MTAAPTPLDLAPADERLARAEADRDRARLDLAIERALRHAPGLAATPTAEAATRELLGSCSAPADVATLAGRVSALAGTPLTPEGLAAIAAAGEVAE